MTSQRTSDELRDLVDAHAGGIEPAEAIFVFGTQHWSPAELASSLYGRGMAPAIVLTGGPARHPRSVPESHVHRDLLLAAGVPPSALLVEDTSFHTGENVDHALPLLATLGQVRTLIAVVKWYHRRALVTLAERMPSLERIYAADYEPFNPSTRAGHARATWPRTSPKNVAKEVAYLEAMRADGIDLLSRTAAGWVRSR